MSRLVIVGAGGHGVVVAEAAAEMENWDEIVFLDDNPRVNSVAHFSIVGTTEKLAGNEISNAEVIVAIGNNRDRLELSARALHEGHRLAVVVHPRSCISPSATISPGTAICAGAIINARVSVDHCCIVNTAATIDHDCKIGQGAHLSPGAHLGGNVTVGECAWIGIGASVRDGVDIGDNAIVGAGSAVVSDIEASSVVGGVPARGLG